MPRLLPACLPLLAALSLPACAHGRWWGPGEAGSGEVSTRAVPVGPFRRLEVAGALDVVVQEGEAPAARVRVDDNLQRLVEVEVVGEVLQVRTRGPFQASAGSRVEVVAPRLEAVEVHGSGDVQVERRRARPEALSLSTSGSGDVSLQGGARRLALETSGSGNVQVEGDAEELAAETSGSGEVRFRGAARRVRARLYGSGDVALEGGPAEQLQGQVSGSGSLQARGLPARDVTVRTSGSGGITVTVQGGLLEASAEGSGDIEWWGEATGFRTRSPGSGEVVQR